MKPLLLLTAALAASFVCAAGDAAIAAIEAGNLRQLLAVHRIFVDRLTGGDTAAQMRDILISSLAASKLFVLTEKEERADAVLRGAAEDLVFTETHQSSDGINAHMNLSTRAGTGYPRMFRPSARGTRTPKPSRAWATSPRRKPVKTEATGGCSISLRGENAPGVANPPRRSRASWSAGSAHITAENASRCVSPARSKATLQPLSPRSRARTRVPSRMAPPSWSARARGSSSSPSGKDRIRPRGPPLEFRSLIPPRISDRWSRSRAKSFGKAWRTESLAGSPAYTPPTNGSTA